MKSVLIALVMSLLFLAGCSALPIAPTPPPKMVTVVIPAQAPEPPVITIPDWSVNTLSPADKDNYSKIGESFLLTICEQQEALANTITILNGYRHTTKNTILPPIKFCNP